MRKLVLAIGATMGLALAGCNSDETAPETTHTPASAELYFNGTQVTPDVVLDPGQTVELEVRFFADDGDEITGIEGTHFATLEFTPTSIATVTDVPNQHFHKSVTAQATAGTGTVTIGYGHDAAADELTFGPYNVSVQ